MNWINTAETGDSGSQLEILILGIEQVFQQPATFLQNTYCLEQRDVQHPRLRSLPTQHLTDGVDLTAISLAELERLTGER
jgi:hypothetical protein